MKAKCGILVKVLVALAFLCSLVPLAAAPAGAISTGSWGYPDISVINMPMTAGAPAQYTIGPFVVEPGTGNFYVGGTDTFTVTFPAGTTLPSTIGKNSVTVTDENSGGTGHPPVAPVVSGQSVTITIPALALGGGAFGNIADGDFVSIEFAVQAGILNPATVASDWTLTVSGIYSGETPGAEAAAVSGTYSTGGSYCVATTGNDITGDGSTVFPWQTIQHAVDQVSSGATIKVAQGTYAGDVSVLNKGVALLGGYSTDFSVRNSALYPTTVSGRFYLLKPTGSSVDGFVITGGISMEGGTANLPLVSNNNVRGVGIGCGIYAACRIEHNKIHGGGGVSTQNKPGSIIADNDIYSNSWGIAANNAAFIRGNNIRNNTGNGITAGESWIIGNRITGNSGLGISWFEGNAPDAHRAIIKNNVILSNGNWGIDMSWPLPQYVANNVVARNGGDPEPRGGGIAVAGNGGVLINNTVAYNQGWGICCYNGPTIVANNIVWGNSFQDLYESTAIYSDIGTGNTAGQGNIQVDPNFVDAAANDYHLQPTSPCIDAGDNAAVPSSLITDLEGNHRIADGNLDGIAVVDMGAYENIPATVIATVKLLDSSGNPLAGGVVKFYYGNNWHPFGTTDASGQVTNEIPRQKINFMMSYAGADMKKSQDVGSNPVVLFQTGKVHSVSGKCTQYYYAGCWKTFTQDMELLPISYKFRFSDGTPITAYTIVAGTVNHIH